MHCVDLGESFPTRIYLQKSASIQPRTSPSKFGGKFNSLFTSLLSCDPAGHAAVGVKGRRRGAVADVVRAEVAWAEKTLGVRGSKAKGGLFSRNHQHTLYIHATSLKFSSDN